MNFALLDLEATGVDTSVARITEIGSMSGFTSNDIPSFSDGWQHLVYSAGYPAQTPEVIEVTGITDEMLNEGGEPFVDVFQKLVEYWTRNTLFPDYIIAHNKSYDEELFKYEMKRHKALLLEYVGEEATLKVYNTPWLCTIDDIPWAKKFKCKKLSHLALDNGVPVDPSKLHRALGDLILMAELIKKAEISLEGMARYAAVPWVHVKVKIPNPFGKGGDGGVAKDIVKGLGWQWQQINNGPIFDKSWVKRIKENELGTLQENTPYPITVVQRA